MEETKNYQEDFCNTFEWLIINLLKKMSFLPNEIPDGACFLFKIPENLKTKLHDLVKK